MEPTAPIPTEPTAPTDLQPFPSLASLVGADAVSRFLAESLGKDAFRRRLPEGMAPALFGWEPLNAALAQHRLGPPRLKLEKDGADAGKGVFRERRTGRNRLLHDVDTALLYERLREGATLILDAVNEISPPLGQLCAGLAAEFVAASQANLYACWGTSQGFDVHWDDHDVFVIQVEGAKRWMLYGQTRASPTRRDHHQDHPRPSEPLQEIVLQPGEMLYLPRGYWHAAVGLGGPTLHLTVGLTRKSGGDLLQWVADRAIEDAVVRADLPLEQDDLALGRQVAAVLAAAVGGADPADLGREFRRHVQASRSHRPQLSFPHIGEPSARYAPDACIRLAQGGAQLHCIDGSPAVVLRHRGVDYTVAGELRAALVTLTLGKPVRYADLEACAAPAAPALVADFVADMLGRGVFVLSAP